MSNQLILALSKGRILEETLPLLADAGITPADDFGKSRKLLFDTNLPDVKLVVIRAVDVPTYVQLGAADLGVAGKDVLLEHGAEGLYEPLDLGISRCRLMTAGIVGAQPAHAKRRVATKFVNVARRYYAEQGIQAEVIKLYGAMELAPLMNLADEIVDIVDTGNTLRANGMEPRELIENISTRLVVNKASMTMKHERLRPLIERLRQAVATRLPAA
ncbi:ATP phosphoribosyltransferase [Salinicola sp. LHM]|jgi:ATP phosphoribosyltransferase|uniref:ATP phosphoribosyltransferase n=1 Tax=Salinicola TaxID=404432 RepID=UPI000B4022B0|nr:MULTISPECIES: ATP phosphoribosyltransferase [Salinicola]WQH34565.1 ATP phosphoribosyltransferase [Salinicola sp. LHM]